MSVPGDPGKSSLFRLDTARALSGAARRWLEE
jgi:hypothetical protein